MCTFKNYPFLISWLIFHTTVISTDGIPFEIVKDYFSWKTVGVVNGFLCTQRDGLKFLTSLAVGAEKIVQGKYNISGHNLMYNIEKWLKYKHFRLGIFMDYDCMASRQIFDKVSDMSLFNMSNIFLIYTRNFEQTISSIEKGSIAFDTDMAVMTNDQIYDVYKIQSYLPVKITPFVKWNPSNLTEIEFRKLPERTDLEGTDIKGMIVITKLQVTKDNLVEQLLNESLDTHLDILSRYSFAVLKHMEDIYNFRIVFNVTNNWGYFNEQSSHWDPGSMFGAMEYGQIDLGLTISRIYAERLAVSTFLPPISKFRTCFAFKHPSTLAAYTAFAMPFTLHSWICIFFMVFLAGVCLRIIRQFNVKDKPPNEPSFPASVLIIIGTMCQQGLSVDSLRIPTRILCIFLELTSLLVYSFYGAAVVGFLLTPSPKTINSLEKLIDSPLKMFAENLSYHKIHFTENFSYKANLAYEKRIKGRTPQQDKFIDLMEGLKRMQKGGFALYAQDTNLYRLIGKMFSSSEICTLSEIEILKLWASIPIMKKTPFKELFYRGVMVTRERGLLNREHKIWYTQRPSCLGHEESGAVRLEATLIAQVLYSFGFLLSVIVYLVEKRIYKNKTKNIM